MSNCQRHSRLLSEGMDHSLPLGQRAAVALHVALCPACAAHQEFLRLLRLVCREHGKNLPEDGTGLSPEARERIENLLRLNLSSTERLY